MTFVDTHAHLWWEDFDPDREAVLTRARSAGVAAILNLGTDLETSRAAVALAESSDLCWAAVGFHPNDADAWADDPEAARGALIELTAHPRVVAIGESGLDFYRDRVGAERQQAALEAHFALARTTSLPIILHNREASTELQSSLEQLDEGVTAILHCFTGPAAFGNWAIERGHYLGLGGVFTFPSSDLRAVVGQWNPDHLLLETDAPFLAPVPHRGQRNEPAFVVDTARAVAAALGMELDKLAALTSANARRVLGLPSEVS